MGRDENRPMEMGGADEGPQDFEALRCLKE